MTSLGVVSFIIGSVIGSRVVLFQLGNDAFEYKLFTDLGGSNGRGVKVEWIWRLRIVDPIEVHTTFHPHSFLPLSHHVHFILRVDSIQPLVWDNDREGVASLRAYKTGTVPANSSITRIWPRRSSCQNRFVFPSYRRTDNFLTKIIYISLKSIFYFLSFLKYFLKCRDFTKYGYFQQLRKEKGIYIFFRNWRIFFCIRI